MPRKSKEKIDGLNNENKELKEKKVVKKKSSTTKKSTSAKKTSSTKKKSESSTTPVKKKTTKSTTSKKATKTTKNAKSSKSTKSVKSTSSKKAKKEAYSSVVEYYDLPFRYNQTVVKILAQTPNTLFVYWDISDKDRRQYLEKYGEDFFNITKPVLLITNQTMNYTFEVEINDFANSWYLHVNDANCDYKIELGRRPVSYPSNITDDFVHISSSNQIEMPNDRILFDELGKTVFFRNTKTNIIEEKSITSLSSLLKIGKIYNIYDLYKEIYKDAIDEDHIGIKLSSSSSSTFK